MPLPADIRPLLGIPYRERGCDPGGVNCWGLVVLAYRHLAGVELPSYAADYTTVEAATFDDVRALIHREASAWQPVPAGQERALDAVELLGLDGGPHIAVVVEPGLMLHVRRRGYSQTDRYTSPGWRRRVLGFHRHAALA